MGIFIIRSYLQQKLKHESGWAGYCLAYTWTMDICFLTLHQLKCSVDNDSIDVEIRLFEGPQATIGDVTIVGNDRTSDHVISKGNANETWIYFQSVPTLSELKGNYSA
jgi:outer membrane protein assembly factor BamA